MSTLPSGAPTTQLTILCPHCRKPNLRTLENLRRARFCQHCGQDVVLNNDGPRYYITRVIKEGGQGAVYEAIDDDQRIYAVKEMLDRALDPKERDEAITRFEAEATMLQAFHHPRVPRVYASFKDDERHYLVMDFVRGEDLEDILKRDGRVGEQQVLIWADQICDVLDLLHNQDPPIIFRDMKPSNIMIERDTGGVKLIDFGIAKVFQHAQRGTQIGTPGYAPPEQYQGIATVESDIYALGATLHHLLTGRDPRDDMPFTFPPVRSLDAAISARTADVVDRAVQKIASDRFHSIAELRMALKPAQPQSAATGKTQLIPDLAAKTVPTATPKPVPPRQQQQPVAVARPGTVAQPQQVAVPTSSPQAKPQSQQPQQAKPKRRLPIGGIIFALIAIVLIAATVLAVVPGLTTDLLPRITQTTPTAQALVQQTYTINDVEVVVPDGTDVRTAYLDEFLKQARTQFGEQTIINQNAPPSFIGSPEVVVKEAGGTRYRATMQGFVLVPR
ncbi:MAG: serine/threonine-protein kinase [Roseiflexaceae bacterium]|nr:serine/threonine-protein kinase [Roseiflexaceae bacterium]